MLCALRLVMSRLAWGSGGCDPDRRQSGGAREQGAPADGGLVVKGALLVNGLLFGHYILVSAYAHGALLLAMSGLASVILAIRDDQRRGWASSSRASGSSLD